MRLEQLPSLLPTRLPYPGAQPIAGQYAASFAPGANADNSFWAPVFHPRASLTLDLQDVGRGADYMSRVAATIFPPLSHDPSARPAQAIFWGASLLEHGDRTGSLPLEFFRAMYDPAVHMSFVEPLLAKRGPTNTAFIHHSRLSALPPASIQLIGGICLGVDVDPVFELAIHPVCLADGGLFRVLCVHGPTAEYLAGENQELHTTVVPVIYGALPLAYLVAGYKAPTMLSPKRRAVGGGAELKTLLTEAIAFATYVDSSNTVAQKKAATEQYCDDYLAQCAADGCRANVGGFLRYLKGTSKNLISLSQ